ncbi:MAG: hypothetical protein UR27_C0013G0021 [Candidatus Peregrinibacteria bacterium GW2011_GWA2_33_10]|nr:MAG: hypothetical protein UR27_C0013G0021 [Candidatus Peregrinibacteria bacterium GW2011_GWA2_33_10]KKP39153.1 MAG: hypothetical protein UR30_C0012G0026 [Candidatus Peregrinibacteria bacterium GW2011_GWC2_33_13]OGJ49487.1 MAG: hypothetical protein A2229_04845 [Candidatus Peregrinibacteria bacterium RIFOXYA2_FULL_33_7]
MELSNRESYKTKEQHVIRICLFKNILRIPEDTSLDKINFVEFILGRKIGAQNEGQVTPIGGKVENGENCCQTRRRESIEETGAVSCMPCNCHDSTIGRQKYTFFHKPKNFIIKNASDYSYSDILPSIHPVVLNLEEDKMKILGLNNQEWKELVLKKALTLRRKDGTEFTITILDALNLDQEARELNFVEADQAEVEKIVQGITEVFDKREILAKKRILYVLVDLIFDGKSKIDLGNHESFDIENLILDINEERTLKGVDNLYGMVVRYFHVDGNMLQKALNLVNMHLEMESLKDSYDKFSETQTWNRMATVLEGYKNYTRHEIFQLIKNPYLTQMIRGFSNIALYVQRQLDLDPDLPIPEILENLQKLPDNLVVNNELEKIIEECWGIPKNQFIKYKNEADKFRNEILQKSIVEDSTGKKQDFRQQEKVTSSKTFKVLLDLIFSNEDEKTKFEAADCISNIKLAYDAASYREKVRQEPHNLIEDNIFNGLQREDRVHFIEHYRSIKSISEIMSKMMIKGCSPDGIRDVIYREICLANKSERVSADVDNYVWDENGESVQVKGEINDYVEVLDLMAKIQERGGDKVKIFNFQPSPENDSINMIIPGCETRSNLSKFYIAYEIEGAEATTDRHSVFKKHYIYEEITVYLPSEGKTAYINRLLKKESDLKYKIERNFYPPPDILVSLMMAKFPVRIYGKEVLNWLNGNK